MNTPMYEIESLRAAIIGTRRDVGHQETSNERDTNTKRKSKTLLTSLALQKSCWLRKLEEHTHSIPYLQEPAKRLCEMQ